jgi:hypothetical protein
MRSSRSIQLMFLGSALAVLGCGGNQQANAKKPCPPRPDGTPDPNCAGQNNNRSHVRTGGLIVIPGMGGGSNTSGVKSGLAGGGTTTSSGAKTGGFGRTGGATSSAAS